MTADAGLASIAARFQADLGYRPDLHEAPGDPEPQDPMARLILALDKNTRSAQFHDRRLLDKARGAYPVPIPAMNYVVASGALGFGAGYGGSQHMGPRTGEFWDITRLTVDGMTTAMQTGLAAEGTATNPVANTVIASISAASLLAVAPAGTAWQVSWIASLQGTIAAGDANNMRLTSPLGTVLEQGVFPGVVGNFNQGTLTFVPGSAGINVQSGPSAASGASAVYAAQITAIPLLADQLTLYKRFGSPGQERLHTFTPPGSTPGPDWTPGKGTCVMRDGDALQLVAGASLSFPAGTQIILSGEAIRVAAEWIGEYFL